MLEQKPTKYKNKKNTSLNGFMNQEKRERILCLALLYTIRLNPLIMENEKKTASIIIPKPAPPLIVSMYQQAKHWVTYAKGDWYLPYEETDTSYIMTSKLKLPVYYKWMHKYGRLHLENIMRYFYTPQLLVALYHTSEHIDIDDTTLRLQTDHFSAENAGFICDKFNWIFPDIFMTGDEHGFTIQNKPVFLDAVSTYHFKTKIKRDTMPPDTSYKLHIKKKRERQRAQRTERRNYYGEKEKRRKARKNADACR